MSIRSASAWAAPEAAAPAVGPASRTPLDDDVFAAAMGRFAPFEPSPSLAVAVSGGADSMALVRLSDRWARARGGRVLALTVDHGLRPEAAAEAARVADWMRGAGIAHRTLLWRPGTPAASQQAARVARYALLEQAAAEEGVLHLLTGHHRDDQIETCALRGRIGVGPVGLSGMAGVRELGRCRLLRPLLGVPRTALRGWCAAHGQAWLEDPSNEAPRFARVRIRRDLAGSPDLAAAILEAAAEAGERRRRLEIEAARLSVAVRIDGWGGAVIDGRMLAELASGMSGESPIEAPALLLSRLLAACGGRVHGPAPRAALNLAEAMLTGEGLAMTIGGCRLTGRRRILIRREWGRAQGRPVLPDETVQAWDGRFDVAVPPDAGRWMRGNGGLQLGALGPAASTLLPKGPMRSVAAAMPALRSGEELVAVPVLLADAAIPPRQSAGGSGRIATFDAWFRPPRPVTDAGFAT